MSVPEILYHYCSNATLLSIVESRTLMLTAITAANDYEDTHRARPFLMEELKKHRDPTHREWLESLVELYDVNETMPFVGCFSENGDQLSQWRGYADDAAGVSIGLRLGSLRLQRHLPVPHESPTQTIGIERVIYDVQVQERVVADLVGEFLSGMKSGPADLESIASRTAVQLRQFSLIFKNPGFGEEAEWRIVHTPVRTGSQAGRIRLAGAIGQLTIRMKGRQVITSIPFPLQGSENDPVVAQVILGPKNPTHLFDLKNLLYEHGFFNVEVSRSSITFR